MHTLAGVLAVGLALGVQSAAAQAAALPFTLSSSTVTYSAADPNERWQGQTALQSLTLSPSPEGLELEATLEPGGFSSGNFIRDANARIAVFETGQFPTATLSGRVAVDAALIGAAPVTRTQHTQFSGQLTLHGVSRPMTFPVTVTRTAMSVNVTASFAVMLSAFEMDRPDLFGVVVDDKVTLSASLTGAFGGE